MQLSERLGVDHDGWRLVERGFDADRAVAIGSNFMCGNGYLGYRATSAEARADDYVALVVTDTYDCADGRWRELTTAPNPLHVVAAIDGAAIRVAGGRSVEWSLDLRLGEFGLSFEHHDTEGHVATVRSARIASMARLHVVAQRWELEAARDVTVEIAAGIDVDVWSLNGVHLPEIATTDRDGARLATGRTGESGIDVAVAAIRRGDELDGTGRIELAAGDRVVIESFGAVTSSNDGPDPASRSIDEVLAATALGYGGVRHESSQRWDAIWRDHDIVIDGDLVDQTALRFCAYHQRICTPAHTSHLPIGARGLSCQAYQGSAFWDQEIYNLPAFRFTEPALARSILEYRHRTLDGARRKAARLGYDGAYYAWISGTTGDELCPDHFFVDVLTGRPIRNHFNVWQMHVAPDVVTTIARYVDVTGDRAFVVEHGAEIAFEVARFLRSFVRYDEWREVYHCIRLLGPDEWHENVDDNAFTNHQTAAALRFAVDTHEWMAVDHPDALAELSARIGLAAEEVDGWRRVRDRMLLPEPGGDDLIEQFAGFFDLEDTTADVLRTRLLHPEEYWGWPNGVAVATQVSKQADVAMLLWMHGDRYDDDVVRANYEYYEPRCSHNSSLSHAAYGMLAARLGEVDRAHRHFRETATVDLLSTQHAVVGGTFIGGIHTAACGGTLQLAVEGFGGLAVRDGRLRVDPHLPASWTSMTYPVNWRGRRLVVTVGAGHRVAADAGNDAAVELTIAGVDVAVEPGATVEVGATP